jgi:hypothetical protein
MVPRRCPEEKNHCPCPESNPTPPYIYINIRGICILLALKVISVQEGVRDVPKDNI